MSTLLNLVLGICTCFIFMGAIWLIVPGGTMKKSVSYCFSLAFLVIIIVPVMSVSKLEIPKQTFNVSQNEESKELARQAAYYLCAAALKDAGISFENLQVNADICEESGILINSVRVVSGHLKSEICSALNAIAPESVVEVINE